MRLVPLAWLPIAVVAVAWSVLLAPRPAAAHAILMESQPAALSTVAPGPGRFVLRYNSRIDRDRSRFELRRPGVAATPLKLASPQPASPDTVVVDAPMTPGQWTLRWQVLAIDGHITRGDVPFTVKAP